MTTLTFESGYAMLQSDSALFGRPAIFRPLGQIAASLRPGAGAGPAARLGLALMPFSALAWMFLAR